MVLTISNGGVYFLQAGTDELINEWVLTCNYWAARTSKFAGGIPYMEYGWNRVASALVHECSMSGKSSREIEHSDIMRSNSSNHSIFHGTDGASTMPSSHSIYMDNVYINDWKPPPPPKKFSVLDEESQMEALKKHVISLKRDLECHNRLRQPISALVCTYYDLRFMHLLTNNL
jgi:PH/SEC7 domain-containing protein